MSDSSMPYEKFRQMVLDRAKEKGLDFDTVPEEQFKHMVESGQALATKMTAEMENLVAQVSPGGGAENPVVVEMAAVVVGVVAGEVAGTISSKKVGKAT